MSNHIQSLELLGDLLGSRAATDIIHTMDELPKEDLMDLMGSLEVIKGWLKEADDQYIIS